MLVHYSRGTENLTDTVKRYDCINSRSRRLDAFFTNRADYFCKM